MFPMTTTAASHHLRSRGYDCRPALLEALVEQGVVTPSRPDAGRRSRWTPPLGISRSARFSFRT